jgi:hypothetical protein
MSFYGRHLCGPQRERAFLGATGLGRVPLAAEADQT